MLGSTVALVRLGMMSSCTGSCRGCLSPSALTVAPVDHTQAHDSPSSMLHARPIGNFWICCCLQVSALFLNSTLFPKNFSPSHPPAQSLPDHLYIPYSSLVHPFLCYCKFLHSLQRIFASLSLSITT
ncbi:uncharacterized protein HMPREF1120_05509 [Exophiala dermatitidis NIH/UT8656]|uniref:Uncharacterized protein n=1 Tax=Exophiala dermatitidis (strain ATCC 34100 / CBS 525.76 / NIH/UT8656) TaxID=858893 RepID=H6BY40_EXODN|nr:uncharacterized protein HMPREF1120_05509 [Exophiala dermatitidis NIH/UT8656]EHY57476.1 hypothetical protein HMPREF1120_05509 [Exophiala dermatitidis NIH/UT8656]